MLTLRDRGKDHTLLAYSALMSPIIPPIMPLGTTSALVGKAFTAAGQACTCLHTIVVLQAYPADLLKDLNKGEDFFSNDIRELWRAADLATERHLWLNLSNMRDKDRFFLFVCLACPFGPLRLRSKLGHREVPEG